ncbi:MAG: serine/threonine protein kinase [Deltaproteobacteria bacterium]|nr:serine/threonine protein kinase [Deltaproteobacteria bacterium]
MSGPFVPPLPEADPLVGQVLDNRYRILGAIARGGMGVVYRAEQMQLGRTVAVKVISAPSGGPSTVAFHRRFYREAQACARLQSPHTVVIHDFGRTPDGTYFIAMELLEGQTLHDFIVERGALPGATAVHVAEQVAKSLAEAHEHGLVHRDLKPSNVFVAQTATGQVVKVLDFGLVKSIDAEDATITKTGTMMGSPKYMSPEQVIGLHVDHRADIYSLGTLVYRLLVGRTPFIYESDFEVMAAHVNVPPESIRDAAPDADISAELDDLVMKCLSKDKNDRFSSMADVLLALRACPEHTAENSVRVDLPACPRPSPRSVTRPLTDVRREVKADAHTRELVRPGRSVRPREKAKSRPTVFGVAALIAGVGLAAWLWAGSGGDEETTAPVAPQASTLQETPPGIGEVQDASPTDLREADDGEDLRGVSADTRAANPSVSRETVGPLPAAPDPVTPGAVATDRLSVQASRRRGRSGMTMRRDANPVAAVAAEDPDTIEEAEQPEAIMQTRTDNRDPWAQDSR